MASAWIFQDSEVPHHGSTGFSGAFVPMVSPIVSIVSSGDKSARKEFIHPRATLMGALGKHSPVDEPLIFVTELAFFNLKGPARLADERKDEKRGEFLAFSRAAFGIFKTRTDRKRLLVYNDCGQIAVEEAHAYSLDERSMPLPAAVVKM